MTQRGTRIGVAVLAVALASVGLGGQPALGGPEDPPCPSAPIGHVSEVANLVSVDAPSWIEISARDSDLQGPQPTVSIVASQPLVYSLADERWTGRGISATFGLSFEPTSNRDYGGLRYQIGGSGFYFLWDRESIQCDLPDGTPARLRAPDEGLLLFDPYWNFRDYPWPEDHAFPAGIYFSYRDVEDSDPDVRAGVTELMQPLTFVTTDTEGGDIIDEDGDGIPDVIDDDIGEPTNQPPEVSAGPDTSANTETPLLLGGAVSDDGLPNGSLVSVWTKVAGPGDVSFGSRADPATTALFSAPGTYELQLEAFDGDLRATDTVTVLVTERRWVGIINHTDFPGDQPALAQLSIVEDRGECAVIDAVSDQGTSLWSEVSVSGAASAELVDPLRFLNGLLPREGFQQSRWQVCVPSAGFATFTVDSLSPRAELMQLVEILLSLLPVPVEATGVLNDLAVLVDAAANAPQAVQDSFSTCVSLVGLQPSCLVVSLVGGVIADADAMAAWLSGIFGDLFVIEQIQRLVGDIGLLASFVLEEVLQPDVEALIDEAVSESEANEALIREERRTINQRYDRIAAKQRHVDDLIAPIEQFVDRPGGWDDTLWELFDCYVRGCAELLEIQARVNILHPQALELQRLRVWRAGLELRRFATIGDLADVNRRLDAAVDLTRGLKVATSLLGVYLETGTQFLEKVQRAAEGTASVELYAIPCTPSSPQPACGNSAP